MAVERAESFGRNSVITTLVRAALEPSDDGGLAGLLGQMTESLQVAGCILWELGPGEEFTVDPPEGRLFVSASNFPTEPRVAIHNLSLKDSPTGWSVSYQRPKIENDLKTNGGAEKDCPFLKNAGAMMAMPITLQDGHRAALSVYRNEPDSFDNQDLEKLQELSDLVPLLYQAIRDRINARLISAVNQILETAEADSRGKLVKLEEKKMIFKQICSEVARTLHCREVSLYLYPCREISLFLNDESTEPIHFDLMATTLTASGVQPFVKKEEKVGLTSWVLNHNQTAWFFDLGAYWEDQDWFDRIYPGLFWPEGTSMRKFVSGRTGIPENQLPNPISVLAIPISIGDKVIGVIRCSIAENPYYFSPRDLKLIKLIAAQIAQCWSTWLGRREMNDENECWQKLVDAIYGLNDFVQKILEEQREPDEGRIWDEALRRIEGIIPDADLNSVRMANKETNEIRFAAILGRTLDETNRIIARNYRTFLHGESAAAQVIRTGVQLLTPELAENGPQKRIFPNTKRSIITPIQDHEGTLGVLDIRSEGDLPFPKHAMTVALLLGRQLGLYHRLAANIGHLRREQKQQIQTWADISHQLKGPINQAKARADRSIEEVGNERTHLRIIQGLCRKAQRVVGSLKLLSLLASEKQIELKRTFLEPGRLYWILDEATRETEYLLSTRRNIRFQVNRMSFAALPLNRVLVDYELFEQAINNVIDNAGKYSFKDTKVLIYGGLTNSRRFHITVRNQGLKIRPDQVKDCVTRDWRSDEAMMTTQEGSGIGLWIVNHILAAHQGELIIVPTTADNYTEVKLVFPVTGS